MLQAGLVSLVKQVDVNVQRVAFWTLLPERAIRAELLGVKLAVKIFTGAILVALPHTKMEQIKLIATFLYVLLAQEALTIVPLWNLAKTAL
jgi:hypothetical protein